ncbi:MAG: hypothetical protein Q8P73_02140, partial [bacterium]|nr:hypothetical protein [bacterium]
MIPSYPFTTGKDYTNFDNEYGSLEDSWKLVAAPAGVDGVGDFARVVAANPNWFNPEPYARWIAPPTANDGTSSFPAGTYVFEGQIEFLDHGFNNIPIEITGRYGSD